MITAPAELLELDKNSATLWPKLLKKAKVTITRGELIEDRRGWILLNIAVPDLIARLQSQRKRENGKQDEVARARIWFHVAEASAPGDYIPELNADNLYLLNPWIPSKRLKFPDLRFSELRKAAEQEKPKAKRVRPSAKAKSLVWASRPRKEPLCFQ